MKFTIGDKELTLKKITWSDIAEFGDYLQEEKVKQWLRISKDIKSDSIEVQDDLLAILKQAGLTLQGLEMDKLKELESIFKTLQNHRDGIVRILSEPMSFIDIINNLRTLKGAPFFIWLAIRDNGIKFEDMDNIMGDIIESEQFGILIDTIEIIGMKKTKTDDSKNDQGEAESTSP